MAGLAQQVFSNLTENQQMVPPVNPYQGLDLTALAAQVGQGTAPEQMRDWFLNSGNFMHDWRNPDGTNIELDRKALWGELSNRKMKEYLKNAGEEALRADFNLIPGMAALGHELSYNVPKAIPRGWFIWSEYARKYRSGDLDLSAPETKTSGPWGGGVDLMKWGAKIIAQGLPESEPQPQEQNLTSLMVGPNASQGEGTEDLPLSYRLMKPYFQSYEDMLESEAEWMYASSKAQDIDITTAMGLSAAMPHVAMNVAGAAVDPAGRVVRTTAKTIGWTVKGLLAGGMAVGGSRGLRAALRGTAMGDLLMTSKLGKTLDLLANAGRGAHPAVDGKAAAEAVRYAEARYASALARKVGDPAAHGDEVISKIVRDVRAGIDHPEKVPTYLTEKQNQMILDGMAADVKAGDPKPLKQTWAYANAVTAVEQGLKAAELPARKEVLKTVRAAVKGLAKEGDDFATFMRPAEKELERLLGAEERGTAGSWHFSSLFDPVWKFTGGGREANRIAGRYIHYQQDYLFDTAVAYQRLKADIPDKAVRQDMIGYMEGTGNPWRGPHDTHEEVTKRLTGHKDWEKIKEHSDYMRERFDNLYREMNELNAEIGDESVAYLDNWMHHMWEETGAKAQAKLGRGMRYQLTPTGSAERPRTIPTYFEGMHAMNEPLTPRTDDVASLFSLVEAETARVLALKKTIRDLNQVGILENGEHAFIRIPREAPAPPGYVPFQSAFTDRLLSEGLTSKERGKTALFVHDTVAPHLRVIIKQPLETQNIQKLAAIAKRSNFMFTLFHMYSLAESSMALLGLVDGPMVNAAILRHAAFAPSGEWAGFEELAHLVAPDTFREAFTRASVSGVKIGPPIHDTMISEFEKVSKRMASRLDKLVPGTPAHKSLQKVLDLQGSFDTMLWGKYHTPMKVIAYDMVFENLKNMRDGISKSIVPEGLRFGKKGLQAMDDEALGKAVGSFINDEFGGQAFETATKGWIEKVYSDPDTLKWLNAAFTSVDWNVSAIRASLSFAQSVPGFRMSNPARGIMGLRHWRNAVMGWAFYANIMNKAMSDNFIWENEPGKKIFYLDTGQRDENGKILYIHIGKQFREIGGLMGFNLDLQQPGGFRGDHKVPKVHVTWDPPTEFIARKLMPYVQVWTNPDESEAMTSRMLQEGKEMGLSETVLNSIAEQIQAFAPFSAGSFTNPALSGATGKQKLALGVAGTVLPISRSPADRVHVAAMAEAMRAGDVERLDQLTLDIAHNRGESFAKALRAQAMSLANNYPTSGQLEPDPLEAFNAKVTGGPLSKLRKLLFGE